MPSPSPEPLTKLSLNLFDADVAYLRVAHGSGYQTEIRNIVRRYVTERKRKASVRVTEQYLQEDFE